MTDMIADEISSPSKMVEKGRAPADVRLLPWIAISAAFTALVVQYSFVYGKLAVYPFYDDVSYFDDALTRLQQLYHGGLREFCLGVVHTPPHSLFSTLLALASFLIFGAHDWAPYAGNVIVILGLAGIVNLLSRGLPRWQRVLLFLFVLTIPISAKAVFEFRPDIASALCAGAGAAMLLSAPLTTGSWKHRVGAGALFGLAMLIKTPTFPLTLIVMLAALGMAMLADLLIVDRRPSRGRLFTSAGQCGIVALLVPLPAYALQFREILHYIWDPVFGKANAMWRSPGTRMWHALYYSTGPGGADMLSTHLYLLLAIILAGLIAAAVFARREDFVRIVCFLVVTAVAYVIPALMSIKQEFFGTTFDWILIFAAVYVLASTAQSGVIGRPALIAALLAGLGVTHFLPVLYLPGGANVVARRRIVENLYGALRQQQIDARPRVFITTTGFVNAAVLDYMALKEGLPAFNFSEIPFSGDLADYSQQIAQADFVIASEQGNSEAYGGFIPSGNIQDQTLALVRDSGAYRQVAAFPTQTPKRYFLFARIPPFDGWRIIDGVGQLEGPYPNWGLPKVRWAYGPKSVASVVVQRDGEYRLVGAARAAVAGSMMRLRIDGKDVGRQVFPNAKAFIRFDFPVRLRAGPHEIEMLYSAWRHAPGKPSAMLFKLMRLIPVADGTIPAPDAEQSHSAIPRIRQSSKSATEQHSVR